MNERIEQLADQCMTERRDSNGVYVEYFDHKKFAELIVKECIGLVEKDIEPELDDSDYAEHWNMALRSASNEIKNHFGVE